MEQNQKDSAQRFEKEQHRLRIVQQNEKRTKEIEILEAECKALERECAVLKVHYIYVHIF